MKPIKILAINSLPTNGNAGLKMVLPILGTQAIPVPSLLLSGIGNMAGHQRFPLPFADLLDSTLTLARQQQQPMAVFVGYLADAGQAALIADAIARYRDLIQFVLIDPVCGDNGRAYVPAAVIESWHSLLTVADLALPNLTEAALLSGWAGAFESVDSERIISKFRERYPHLTTVVTGIVADRTVTNRWLHGDGTTDFSNLYYPTYFSGTGDAFGSLLIRFHCLDGLPLPAAIARAGQVLEQRIEQSIAAGRSELVLDGTW
jgi:pyridoxine kinase